MHPQFISLDIQYTLDELHRYSNEFSRQVQTVLVEAPSGNVTREPVYERTRPIGRRQGLLVVIALVHEVMGQYLDYREPYSSTPAFTQALCRTDHPTEAQTQLVEQFLGDERVDDVITDFRSGIARFIQHNRWQQWDLLEQHNMLFMVSGQDYRITVGEYHLQKQAGEEPVFLTINLQAMGNYLRRHLTTTFGGDGYSVPLRKVIARHLKQYFPLLHIDSDLSLTYSEHCRLTTPQYMSFHEHHIQPVLDVFIQSYLGVRLNNHTEYTLDITPDYTLNFNECEPSQDQEAKACQQIMESINRGDWVPERDRRRLAQHDRKSSYTHLAG